MNRTCKKCGETKMEDFYKLFKDRGKVYRSNICTECNAKRIKDYTQKNKDILHNKLTEWRKLNPEKYKAQQQRCYKKRLTDNAYQFRNHKSPEAKYRKRLNKERARDTLLDCYIVDRISQQLGVSAEAIRRQPKLIEVKRQILKIKRAVKNQKNG